MTQIPQSIRILVTGAGGRLGRLLRRAARRDAPAGCRYVFQSRAPGADVIWTPGDPPAALPRADMVVALWGKTAGPPEVLAENETLVAASHAVAAACGARRLLHVSSAAVYGPGEGMSEATPTCPAGDYGRAKLTMERAVAHLPRDGIEHGCLRLANVVGADSLAPGLTGRGPVTLDRFADGNGPLRSYLAAGDLLAVLSGLAQLPPGHLPPVLNVAAPAPVRMEALVRAAGRALHWRDAPDTAIQQVTLDATRLTRLLPAIAFRQTAGAMISDWQTLEAMP